MRSRSPFGWCSSSSRPGQFRRIATRYDKLQQTFFAALCLVAAFILVRNS